jgi:hypothetical protein
LGFEATKEALTGYIEAFILTPGWNFAMIPIA